MAKIYIRDYPSHAGKWIYNGFASAWESLGYEVERFTHLNAEDDTDERYIMMADSDIHNFEGNGFKEFFESFKHIFLYVSPNEFPPPWGNHPNYVSTTSSDKNRVDRLNKLENVTYWSFVDSNKGKNFYRLWNKVEYVPLAFDNINYVIPERSKWKYDVSFIGGWADNGYNTKKKIMINIFKQFKDSGLKCGFFVNKNLSHEQEIDILVNSRVALNIHDDYQKIMGLDLNERTFKALALCGVLVNDYGEHNDQIRTLDIPAYYQTSPEPEKIVSLVKEKMVLGEDIRVENRNKILSDHTYVERVKQLLGTINE